MSPNLTKQWIAQCTRRLREHRRVALSELEDTARELATKPDLRELSAVHPVELGLGRSGHRTSWSRRWTATSPTNTFTSGTAASSWTRPTQRSPTSDKREQGSGHEMLDDGGDDPAKHQGLAILEQPWIA